MATAAQPAWSSAAPPAEPYEPLLMAAGALAAGIVADRLLDLPFLAWISLGIAALACWRRRRPSLPARWALLLAVAAVGGGRHQQHWQHVDRHDVALAAQPSPRPAAVEVLALERPRWIEAPEPDPMRAWPADERSTLRVRLAAIRDDERWRPVSGTARLTVPGRLGDVEPGDRLRVYGLLSRSGPPRNPGEPDWQRLARGRRQLGQLRALSVGNVELLERGRAWSVRRPLERVRGRCRQLLRQHVAAPHARVAVAMLLGEREQLERRRTQGYLATGTMHLLAISGLHVGILAAGFWAAARLMNLPRRTALVAVIAAVLLYAVLAQARPPVLRAAVLVTVCGAARLAGRRALSFNTLAAAAILVLAINPAWLFEVGTHLSFLAVATLCCCQQLRWPTLPRDPLARHIARTRPWPRQLARRLFAGLVRSVATTTAVWLVTAPLVAQHFHVLAPWAVVLNPLVWLPTATALYSGFLLMLLGDAVPGLAPVCGWICWLSLELLERCIRSAEVAGPWWVAGPPHWWLAGFYLLVGGLFWSCSRAAAQAARRRLWCALLLWLLAGAAAALPRPPADTLRATFVSVGHGTSVLVELPGGTKLLYDAGSMGPPDSTVDTISRVLWWRGVRRLDAVVLSHADLDHYNALPGLLERFEVGVVYVGPTMFDVPSPPLQALDEACRRRSVPVRVLVAGDRLDAPGPTRLQVLHPPPDGVAGSDNANSIVLQIEYAGRRLLLPGDLEGAGLERLLAMPPRACQVLMAPHHGSLQSEPRRVARWAKPAVVVISGRDRGAGAEARSAWAEHGADVLHTDTDGAVVVELDAESARAFGWRSSRRVHRRGAASGPGKPGGQRVQSRKCSPCPSQCRALFEVTWTDEPCATTACATTARSRPLDGCQPRRRRAVAGMGARGCRRVCEHRTRAVRTG